MLERLTETGIVTAERAGSAILYEANRDHLAWPAVETLVGIRSALLQRLGDLLASWDHLRKQAALYGSAARADVDTLRVAVQRWTGNHAQRVVISESAWKKMANDGDPLVGSVRRDGIDLIGQSEAVA